MALKNLVWKAATANQVRKFENTMDCIKNSYFDERRNKTLEQLEEGQVWCKYAYNKFEANQEKAKLHMVRRMSVQ